MNSSGSGVRSVVFRPYSTGRILRFAYFAELKIEVRDRTLARTGPTAGNFISLETGGGKQLHYSNR